MQMRQRRARGFTLVELMVVVAIIAVVGGLAARMYSKGARGETAPAFARNLMSTLLDARHLAVTLGQPVSVAINGAQASATPPMTVVTSSYDAASSTWKQQATLALPSTLELCTPSQTVNLGASATPTCPFSGTDTLCFYPNGRTDLLTSGVCQTTSKSSGSGATLYLATYDQTKKYQLPIWGLTGMTKVIDQW